MTTGIKVTTTIKKSRSTTTFNLHAILDLLVALAVGFIQRRTAKGLDYNGNPFPGYSSSYAEQLRAMGESTKVDLTVTGAYLADIGERSRTVNESTGSARATIGPGTGTSAQVAPPSKGKARAVKTGARSPAHNILARYLSVKFPHLGLTRDEQKKLAAMAVKVALKQTSR